MKIFSFVFPVSRRIKDQKQGLGATLFDRTISNVRLIDSGHFCLREVRNALQMNEIAHELVGAQSTSLTKMLRRSQLGWFVENSLA